MATRYVNGNLVWSLAIVAGSVGIAIGVYEIVNMGVGELPGKPGIEI
jgi:hypothetical protein